MLNDTQIRDILHCRLPAAELKNALLTLTAENIDTNLLVRFLTAFDEMLISGASTLSKLGTGAIDCTGTGGSGLPHFNTSTTVAFVLASAGLKVVKCGNVGATSTSGSFDFLQRLAFPRQLPLEEIPDLLERSGMVFLFAPQFYPGLSRLAPIRKSLGVRTIFNFIGPLLNPARPEYRVLGVCSSDVQKLIAGILAQSPSSKRALVVRGENGMDELIPDGITHIATATSNGVDETQYQPTIGTVSAEAMSIEATPEGNVRIFQRLIAGKDQTSNCYHMACLNSGAAFFACGQVGSIAEGAKLATELLKSGAVKDQYERARRIYARHLG